MATQLGSLFHSEVLRAGVCLVRAVTKGDAYQEDAREKRKYCGLQRCELDMLKPKKHRVPEKSRGEAELQG